MKHKVTKQPKIALCRHCGGTGFRKDGERCTQCGGSGRVTVSAVIEFDIRPYNSKE